MIVQKVFIAIVCSAVFSSIIMGPWMRWALKRRKAVVLQRYLHTGECCTFLIEGEEKNDALRTFGSVLPSVSQTVNAASIADELVRREDLFSTAVGEGIAVPHVRVAGIVDPIVLFGLSKKGIDWNAPDGKPVHFVVFLLSPENANDLHVEILAQAVTVLKNRDHQKQLLAANDAQELVQSVKAVFGSK